MRRALRTLAFAALFGASAALGSSAVASEVARADATPEVHHMIVTMQDAAPITVDSMAEAASPHEERPAVSIVYAEVAGDPFRAWREQVAGGHSKKRDVKVAGVDSSGKTVFTMIYRGALPIDYAHVPVKGGDPHPRVKTTLSFDAVTR